jgi:molybdate transport system substrate-binding protein
MSANTIGKIDDGTLSLGRGTRRTISLARRAAYVCLSLWASACQAPDPEVADAAVAASHASITVITSGGFTAAFDILAPMYEEATGIDIVTAYGSSMGGGPQSMPVRLERGEPADVLIFNDNAYEPLAAAGHLDAASRTSLARSQIGMAVRSGAPKPDISTKEAFVEALLAAESIGYSASVSGTYLSTVVFPGLGIWEQIEPKAKRIVTERVASVVARGEVEIGFQAVSEILSIEGADFVGPIPEELQQVSTFLAVVAARAENPDEARRLIEFLSSAAVAPIIASTGLEPVAATGGRP